MDLLHEHCISGYIPADRRIVSSLIVGGFMSTRNLLACVLLFTVGACWGQQQPTFNWQSLPASGLVVTGDFNRDGWPDLAVLDTDSGEFYIYLGTGNGNFNLVNIYSV